MIHKTLQTGELNRRERQIDINRNIGRIQKQTRDASH